MSEDTAIATPTEALTLTPPEPLPAVTPEKAAGLVPLSTEQKSKLEERVDQEVQTERSIEETGTNRDDTIAPEAPRQPTRRQAAKIGRNDVCWCGSGKKWKKCHYPDEG